MGSLRVSISSRCASDVDAKFQKSKFFLLIRKPTLLCVSLWHVSACRDQNEYVDLEVVLRRFYHLVSRVQQMASRQAVGAFTGGLHI